MSNIFKFHHVVGSNIKKTYTFNDNTLSSTKDIPIYDDDMIINIKHKLSSLFDNQSHHEIFLFCKSKDVLNQSVYYQILTQDDNIKLTTEIFKRFVSNIAINNNFLETPNNIPTKQLRSFYKNKQLWNKETSIITPIGIHAFHRKKYIFHHNPFFCDKEDEVIADDMKKFINTENRKLLFKYAPENNDIYFCFADEVLNFFKSTQINKKKQEQEQSTVSEKYLLDLYFPNLVSKKISSLTDLQSLKVKLKSDSNKEYASTFKEYNKNIELLHNYSLKNISNLNYHVKHIHFTIHPNEPLKLPLNIIFKKVNSSQLIPFVKYNPGKELENIYRLYTNEFISNKGQKIPSLYVENKENSRKIRNISSNMLYNNRIGFYLDLKHLSKSIPEEVYCILLSNGDIQIKLDPTDKYDINSLENIIIPIIKKYIIDVVNTFVQKKSIYYFKSFTSKNIELNKINVVFSTDEINELSFKNLKCTSSVFSVVNKNKKKNIYDLTYKRVSFYQKMNDVQSFINLKLQEAISIEEIKQMVMVNFNLSEEKAVEVLDGFLKETRLAVDAFENRKIKVEDNPGFDIHIETKNTDYVNIKLKQVFEINNIDDITYISNDIIKRYINAILNINKLETPLDSCVKKVQEKKIEQIKEIYENPLEDAKIDFDNEEDDDDLLDLMSGFEDNDEESQTSSKTKSNETSKSSSLKKSAEDSIDLNSMDDELSTGSSLSLSGGANKNIDLTSIKIKGSKNWFTNRLREREPDVFVLSKEEEKSGKYTKYTKGCPWQYKKQPIILNDDELKKIKQADKKSNSKSYDGLVKYRGFNYICPRYWCFKDDNGESRSISFQQINNGECGGWDAVNPKNAASLQPGKRIVELTDDRMRNPSKSNNPMIYKPLFPFLQKSDNHPKGFCAPCCSQVPLEYQGFPGQSENDRKQKKQEEEIYFKDFYTPGKKKGKIVLDESVKNDEMVRKQADKWEGLGPSFKITKSNNNIKITDINTTDNDSKKLNKVDLIPKNKYISKNPSRDEVDKLLQKSKNNQRYKTCTGKPDETQKQATKEKQTTTEKQTTKKGRKPKNATQQDQKKEQNQEIMEQRRIDDIQITTKRKIKPFLFEFPLKTPDSFGYLKPSLQKFIQYDTTSICYNNPPNDYSLKNNSTCLLRLGVKKNNKQSFLENIAKIKNKSLQQIKKLLVKNISISKFIIAFRGTLIDVFYDKSKKIDKKNKDELIKNIDDTIVNDFISIKEVGEKLINAYINFMSYLKDDKINIDYTYLWDFICKPNNKNNAGVLFDKGVNLIIFNSPQDDITDKIEIICPKQTFSDEIFSELKPSIMLYKEGAYFEPLVLYNNKSSKLKMLFDYEELSSDTMIHTLFSDIKTKIIEGCSLKPSIPEKYDYRKNISAKSLIEKLVSIKNISVVKQVIHYNYKTIGIIAKTKNTFVYIPCHPSSIIIDLDYEYFDSQDVLFDAIKTFNELSNLATKHNIPCLPIKILITDQTNVTGFITETNQLVPTQQFDYDPALFVIKNRNGKDIPKSKSVINIKENSSYFSDKDIMKLSIEDMQRNINIRNFLLEKNFYMCFRNILKKTINEESNGNIRQELIDILDTTYKVKKSDTMSQYKEKFKKIQKIINKLVDKNIEYVIYQNAILNSLYQEVKKEKSICFTNNNSIALPDKNLVDGSDNKEKYTVKIIDELIRFPRLRDYILYNKSITSIDVINYSVNKDEIVILEEELFNDYLVNVVLKEPNKYVNSNQDGFTKAIKTKNYKTIFDIDYNTDVENKKQEKPTDKEATNNKKEQNKEQEKREEQEKRKEQEKNKENRLTKELKTIHNTIKNYITDIDEVPNKCSFAASKNKSVVNKLFNNYDVNKHLIFHKISAPHIIDTNEKRKVNCSWSVMQEIYYDYTKIEISKTDLCKALLFILINIHNDNTFVTKPGQITKIPNYSKILEMSHRREAVNDWPKIEEKEEQQWSHLFNIINSQEYYLTEFELYLLCDYFKIPCIIHGTTEKKSENKKTKENIYKKSKIKFYDPLYTTFNTSHIGKTPENSETVKNNLYTNKNNDSFCYIIGFVQFRVSDYYNKEGIKNNIGFNKYYRSEYNIPYDIGLLKTTEDSYKIDVNKEQVSQLINHSITPTVNQYVDLIFKKQKDTELSIYESHKNEYDIYKTNKGRKTKLKIKQRD